MYKQQQVESPTSVLETSSGNLFRYDGPAGTVVFLVALPLCLGIALASGAPLFSGIIAGIIGGLVVAVLSGSQVSVSGPAAGLAVIVATGIATLGSFRAFLTALVLAGILQFILGTFKAGVIAQYVPNSVIKGMLAAIGVLIILKQIPHALGRDKDWEGDLSFFAVGGDNALTDIAAAVMSASPGAVAIAAASLTILYFWDKLAKSYKFFKLVPGVLVTVLLGIAMNQAFGFLVPTWKLTDAQHMVSLPVAESSPGSFRTSCCRTSASSPIKQFGLPPSPSPWSPAWRRYFRLRRPTALTHTSASRRRIANYWRRAWATSSRD